MNLSGLKAFSISRSTGPDLFVAMLEALDLRKTSHGRARISAQVNTDRRTDVKRFSPLLPAPVIPLAQTSAAVSAENLWGFFIATAREEQENFRHLAADRDDTDGGRLQRKFAAPPPDRSQLSARAFQQSPRVMRPFGSAVSQLCAQFQTSSRDAF